MVTRLDTFVSSQREKGIKKELSSRAFKMIASIDNIDVLSHFATAYAGKKSNIWYGRLFNVLSQNQAVYSLKLASTPLSLKLMSPPLSLMLKEWTAMWPRL